MNTPSPAVLPAPVAWLGYGGLLPFIVLATAIAVDDRHAPYLGDALLAYGAVILSFIGALHWGFAMVLSELGTSRRNACFIWSVIPALIAWPALLLPPLGASILLVTGFLAHYWQDRRLNRCASLPLWYLPLRFRLTCVACVCLCAGAFSQGGW